MKRFKHIIYAGTFDRLHIGHKKLLDRAFELAEKVAIGITTEELVKNKILNQVIEPLDIRRRTLEKYLKEKKYLEKAKIFVLNDIYGPSTSLRTNPSTSLRTNPSTEGNDFDSILVTELTKKNAIKINEIREKRKLGKLEIIEEPLVRGDDGEIVSSDRIRLGEIDREGRSYELGVRSYLGKKNPTSSRLRGARKELILPKEMRKELRKPLGKVVGGSVDRLSEAAKETLQLIIQLECKPTMVIAVGDIITESLLCANFEPDLKIIDYKSRRSDLHEKSNIKNQISKIQIKNQKYSGINQPGTININAAQKIKFAISNYIKTQKKQLLIIEGEEDLLALPAILFAPVHSIVLYGQFDLGVVVVEVTEEKREQVMKLIKKFR